MPLDEYAIKYGADKASTHHNYTAIYERTFAPVKDTTRIVLEVGIGAKSDKGVVGRSLKICAELHRRVDVIRKREK